MKNAMQQGKENAILSKVFRYPEGVMSRKDFLNLMRIKGAKVEEYQKPLAEFNRAKYNRLSGAAQEEYERKCFKENKQAFQIVLPDGCTQDITQTEYDYFKASELAEDINTQKAEISLKIEAGTATEAEESEYMEQDFEFFRKYCS